MYAKIVRDEHHNYTLDGYVSDDDEFSYKGVEHTKAELKAAAIRNDTKVLREHDKHLRYVEDPKLEDERFRLKKRYKQMKDMLIFLNRMPDKEFLHEWLSKTSPKFIKNPDSVYIKKAIGGREVFQNLREAVDDIQKTDILLVVEDMFVKCTDIKDCEEFVGELDKLRERIKRYIPENIPIKGLLLDRTFAKLTFVLKSSGETIESVHKLLLKQLRGEHQNITIENGAQDGSLIIISSGVNSPLTKIQIEDYQDEGPQGYLYLIEMRDATTMERVFKIGKSGKITRPVKDYHCHIVRGVAMVKNYERNEQLLIKRMESISQLSHGREWFVGDPAMIIKLFMEFVTSNASS